MRCQVPVHAIKGDVGFSTHEPPGHRRLPFEHVRPLPEPVQLTLRQLAPKLLRVVRGLLVQLAVALHTLHVRLLDELRGGRINVRTGHRWILSKCNYSPARKLAAAHAFEQHRRFRQGMDVDVRPDRAFEREREDGCQILTRAQIASAHRDSLQDRVYQRQFVRTHRQAYQHQGSVPAQRAKSLLDGGTRGRHHNRRIHTAVRFL